MPEPRPCPKRSLFLCSLTGDSGSSIRFWNMACAIAGPDREITFLERKPAGVAGKSHPHVVYETSGESRFLPVSIANSLRAGLRLVRSKRWDSVYALKPMPNVVLPALLARRRGGRIVLDVDDLDFEYYPRGLIRAMVRFCFRNFPRRFDTVTYHVEALRDFLREQAHVPESLLRNIPQGVDIRTFQDLGGEVPERIVQFKSKYRVIVYMASLGITSDFEDIIPTVADLLHRHPDWGLLVIGHGVRLDLYRRRMASHGIGERILFSGYLPHRTIPAVLSGCLAGLHYLRPAGANRYRAIMKIREYLAVALPVVANDSGDCREFRPYLQLVQEPAGMLPALERVAAGDGRHQAEAGRRFVEENLDWIVLADRIRAVLDR
jgi:glycosyltransferase involved in cell wall biosynthesis